MTPPAPKRDDIEACAVRIEGEGTNEERVARILKTFSDQGWTYVETITPLNDVPAMIFKRPKVKL